MIREHPAPSTPDRRIALLIDADNVAPSKIDAIVAQLSAFGIANVRRAYGDWTSETLKGWKEKLHLFAIRPMQQFSYSTGKNATDMALVIDAMELLYTQRLDGFCIVSSDADFTPLVMQLKANGRDVHGFGERKTPKPFVNACTSFLYLDGGGDGTAIAGNGAGGPQTGPATVDDIAVRLATPVRNLAGDTKLIIALRSGVEACARQDGWAPIAAVGCETKRQAAIDPRAYGAKSFTDLFEKTRLFDIVRSASGHAYVADKRNKARAPSPEI
ncbi:hypothetical protein GCM10011380_32960 [Sphingomonas metalli]|uniref:NYN domain-containing protein n=1 Tax=Sphingomonas metalli TaxID=1779358 RepID=A0A916TD80_9SPHN|nr:NYN domain-containing protein [Sphingomonas metalli]GGB40909.1 hypothetical protein GCM10011380_32960 [Sphingomonas metalli]